MRLLVLDLLDLYYPCVVNLPAVTENKEAKSKAQDSGAGAASSSESGLFVMVKPKKRLKMALMHRMQQWAPQYDMVEKENEVVIPAEIPGLRRKDIKVDYYK